ncbi:hypothetical protein M9458_036429, partial [Cirrhinus mrigala]
SAFHSGGYRLGSAPSNNTASDFNVININDSDEDTSIPRKRKAAGDECSSGSQSPSVDRGTSYAHDTSSQCTPPETDEILSPHVESSPERNTIFPQQGQHAVASSSDTGSPRTSNTSQGEKTPLPATSHTPEKQEEPIRISAVASSSDRLPRSSFVPCHYCPSSEQKVAVKTCLVCGASMCSEHLRAHLEKAVFQSHPLVNAVEDVSLWRCQEHQEMNRIYFGSHKGHECISIREAEQQLR